MSSLRALSSCSLVMNLVAIVFRGSRPLISATRVSILLKTDVKAWSVVLLVLLEVEVELREEGSFGDDVGVCVTEGVDLGVGLEVVAVIPGGVKAGFGGGKLAVG